MVERRGKGDQRAKLACYLLISAAFLLFIATRSDQSSLELDTAGIASAGSHAKARTTTARRRLHVRIPPPPRLEGTTRFVRRLEAGLYFESIRPLIDCENHSDAAVGLEQHAGAILRSDGLRMTAEDFRASLPETARGLHDLVGRLTTPRRDLHSFELAGESKDPLGRDLLVRFWSRPTASIPSAERTAIVRSFRHIVETVRGDTKRGFDVLVAKELGRRIFPRKTRSASGVYVHADDLAFVNYDSRARYRTETAKHELIHALWRRSMGWRNDRRVVSEGVAEYLRHCQPGDVGLRVPRERLRAMFGSLRRAVAFLKRAGIPTDRFSPARLLTLRPAEFYGLGRIGYLLAPAVIARVGGDVVEECFHAESNAPILHAAEKLTWMELMTFIVEPADAPRSPPALVVADVAADLPDAPVGRAALRNALSRLAGTRVKIGRLLKIEAEMDARALAGTEWDRTTRKFLFLDRSAALDAASVRESPGAEPETARVHLQKLTGRFSESVIFSLDSAPRALRQADLAEAAALEIAAIPAALYQSGASSTTYQKPAWLFALGSPLDDPRGSSEDKEKLLRKRVSELKAALAGLGRLDPSAVLIVDYTREGPSAAQIVERALRAVLHESVPIGVWRADKDGVISASLPHVYETPR